MEKSMPVEKLKHKKEEAQPPENELID